MTPLLLVLGPTFLIAGWFLAIHNPKAPFKGWQPVPAVVLSSTLTQMNHVNQVSNRRQSTFQTWRLDISFAYQAALKTRVSLRAAPHRIRNVRPFQDGPPDQSLLELHDRYPAGAMTIAMVNPADPDEAYLLWWRPLGQTMLGWAFLLLGAGLLLAALLKR